MIRVLCSATLLLALLATATRAAESSLTTDTQPAKAYNVLFIAVDDLNDWVGCLGGNSQALSSFTTNCDL